MEQRSQGSFLFGQSTISPEVMHAQAMPNSSLMQIHQRAMHMSSPSTLSQHVHAYSHVGKTKSGSNSSSSVGSQNGSGGSANSVPPHNASSSAGSQGPMQRNPANFTNPLQFSPNTNYSVQLTPMMQSAMATSSITPQQMAAMPMQQVVSHFGTMLSQSQQHAAVEAALETPAEGAGAHGASRRGGGGSRAPGRTSNTSNSASSSSFSFSYPSGGNSGGSNSSDTRTQLSSGESEEDGGGGGEGLVCRRTARREYHKKIERKRRDRMRMLYDKLRALTEASELADKNGVLEGAIALIQELKQQNQELLARAAVLESGQCSSSSTGEETSTGETGDSREGSVASSGDPDTSRLAKRPKTNR